MTDWDEGAQVWAEWTHFNWYGDVCGAVGGREHAYFFVNSYEVRPTGERIANEERVREFIREQGLEIVGYGLFPIPSDPEADASTFVFAAISKSTIYQDELRHRFYDLMDYHPVSWSHADDDDEGVTLDRDT